MLSKIRQLQHSFGWLLLYKASKIVKGIEQTEWWLPGDGAGGHRKSLFNGYKVTVIHGKFQSSTVPVLIRFCALKNLLSR